MAEVDPRAFAKQFAAAVNAHDMNRLAALFLDEALIYDIPRTQMRIPGSYARGREAVELYYGPWFEAVPDLQVILVNLIASQDQAALEFTFQGTQRGELLGVQGSGNRIGCRAVSVFQFMHGRVHEQRLYYDFATLERQMKGQPAPEVGTRRG